MAIRPIKIWPAPILSQVSEPGDLDDVEGAKLLATDLLDTLAAAKGIGLSAIQIGVAKRAFAIGDRVYFNPVLELLDEPYEVEEGCLSLPGVTEKAMRYPEVTLTAYVINGDALEKRTYAMWGLEARCAQHENEHLDGKLMIGDVGPVSKDILKRKIAKHLRHNK